MSQRLRPAAPVPVRHTTRWHRIVAVGAVMATATMTLSGCLKYEVGLTVGPDDTVSGTVVLSRNVLRAPSTGGSQSSSPPSIPIPGGISSSAGTDAVGLAKPAVKVPTISVADYRNGDEVGYKCTFDKTSFADARKFQILDRRGGALQFSRSGQTVAFSSKLNLKYPTGSTAQAALVRKNFNGQVTITFPGRVLESNGKFNGSTVTWTLAALKENVLTAKIQYDKQPVAAESNQLTKKVLGVPVWILGVGALVVIILIAGLIALLRARKKDQALDHTSKPTANVVAPAHSPPADGSDRPGPPADHRATEATGTPAWPATSDTRTGSSASSAGSTVVRAGAGDGGGSPESDSSATQEYSVLPPPPPPQAAEAAAPPGRPAPPAQSPRADTPSARFVAAPPPPQFIPVAPVSAAAEEPVSEPRVAAPPSGPDPQADSESADQDRRAAGWPPPEPLWQDPAP